MNIEEVLENIKRHLDYVNATKQKSIRDTEIEAMYKEIERLKNIIKEAKEYIETLNKYGIGKQAKKELLEILRGDKE